MRSIVVAIVFTLLPLPCLHPDQRPDPPAPTAPPDVIGVWVMTWGGIQYYGAKFGDDGSYSSGLGDWEYEGAWSICGDHLIITERSKELRGRWVSYRVKMNGSRTGTFLGRSGAFKLE